MSHNLLNTVLLIIIIILIMVLSIFASYAFYNRYFSSKNYVTDIEILKIRDNVDKPEIIENNLIQPPIMMPDLLTELDKRTLFDPLSEPSKRPPRHVISPVIGNPYFNYPTRGFTDSYSLQGYLIKQNVTQESFENNPLTNDNQILKLFGREKYPNSSQYEYYVIVNTGNNDNIKYFLERQKKELFDNDNVYIDILHSNYNVKPLKNKTFEYNPINY